MFVSSSTRTCCLSYPVRKCSRVYGRVAQLRQGQQPGVFKVRAAGKCGCALRTTSYTLTWHTARHGRAVQVPQRAAAEPA